MVVTVIIVVVVIVVVLVVVLVLVVVVVVLVVVGVVDELAMSVDSVVVIVDEQCRHVMLWWFVVDKAVG